MIRLKPFPVFVLCICSGLFWLSACQPEVPPYNPPATNDSTAKLLRKVVVNEDGDSTTITYTYNAAKQVIAIDVSEYELLYGTTMELHYIYHRNAAGLIVSTEETYGGVQGVTYTRYHYGPGPSPQLKAGVVYSIESSGVRYSDSTVFIHNGLGQITKAVRYNCHYTGNSGTYTYHGENERYYDNVGNMYLHRNLDSSSSSQLIATDTLQFVFDDKVGALPLTQNELEIVLFRGESFWMNGFKHNIVKVIEYMPGYPPDEGFVKYVYNLHHQPVFAKWYSVGSTDTTYVGYTYQ